MARMFGFKLLGVVVCAGLVACETDVNDFDHNYLGYEFIFHDTRNLSLIIHRNKCYFLPIPDNKENAVQQSEGDLIGVIQQNDPEHIQPSTLDAVRDKYQDRLADFHCVDKNIFEITIEICPSGWSSYNGSCYKFTRDHVKHDTAMGRCKLMGSYLVEVTSSGENRFLQSMLLSNLPRESKAWIGLDDKDQEGKFVLPSTGQEPQYHHWDHREPNNWLYNEDCVVMDPRTGFWFDESCTFQQHAFVCEQ